MTLIVPVVVTFLLYTLWLIVLRHRFKPWKVLAINFLLSYGLVIAQAAFFEHYYQVQWDRYDTNGNGLFESYEQTEGFAEAMERVVQDTGRTFAPIFGFIISGFFTFILSLLLPFSNWLFKKFGKFNEST